MEGEEGGGGGGGGGKRERGEGVWVLEQSLHSHAGAEPQVEVGRVSGSGQLMGQILFLHINRKWKPEIMKSSKVQTLGTVALHAATDCTDDASIVGLGPLNWAIL